VKKEDADSYVFNPDDFVPTDYTWTRDFEQLVIPVVYATDDPNNPSGSGPIYYSDTYIPGYDWYTTNVVVEVPRGSSDSYVFNPNDFTPTDYTWTGVPMQTYVYYYESDDENDNVDFTKLTDDLTGNKDWYWIVTYVVKDEQYIVWNDPTSVEGPFGFQNQLFTVINDGTGNVQINLTRKDDSQSWNISYNTDPAQGWNNW
jgi:hypothetical protein